MEEKMRQLTDDLLLWVQAEPASTPAICPETVVFETLLSVLIPITVQIGLACIVTLDDWTLDGSHVATSVRLNPRCL
jgi:hypothetical protein